MLVLVALRNRLIAVLQKTVTFRAAPPHFAPKPQPKPHRKATLWGNVVPMPLSSVVGRRSSVVLHPLFSCGGLWGVSPWQDCFNRQKLAPKPLQTRRKRLNSFPNPTLRTPFSHAYPPFSVMHLYALSPLWVQ
jgi:hypothetical protein